MILRSLAMGGVVALGVGNWGMILRSTAVGGVRGEGQDGWMGVGREENYDSEEVTIREGMKGGFYEGDREKMRGV
jgi:hypothetical protein